MTIVLNLLHRIVAPFLGGVCMAATIVVGDMASMVALVSATVALGFLSFPAGVRMIARLADPVV